MRGGRFQRAAASAFLPTPALLLGAQARIFHRIVGWLIARPRAGSERVAGVFGGAGVVKLAAAGSAAVLATATLAGVRPPGIGRSAPPVQQPPPSRHDASPHRQAVAEPPAPPRSSRSASPRMASPPRRPASGSQRGAELEFAVPPQTHSSHSSSAAPPAGGSSRRQGNGSSASSEALHAYREFGPP
jgi:hypothetical protein